MLTLTVTAQETFTVRLELVNPTGKLDQFESYFRLSLVNNRDSAFIITRGVYPGTMYWSYVQVEYLYVDGKTEKEAIMDLSPVDFGDKRAKLIGPKQTLTVRIPLFPPEGLIPENLEFLEKVQKVRLIVKDLKYIGVGIGSPLKLKDYYTNWLTIDKEGFRRIIEEMSHGRNKRFKCDGKYVEPFFWDYQNESYTLEELCSFSSRDKKYNYMVLLSDYDVARGMAVV